MISIVSLEHVVENVEKRRAGVVRDYLREHGATPYKAAREGMVDLYQARHITGGSSGSTSRDTLRLAITPHILEMINKGEIRRGPRPEQILTLAKD